MSSPLSAYACEIDTIDTENAVLNYSVNDEIGFILYKNQDDDVKNGTIDVLSTKKYTSDSYKGHFYYKSSKKKYPSIHLLQNFLMMEALRLVTIRVQK